MRFRLAALCLAAASAALSACATGPDPVGEVRARAWDQVRDRTDVTRLGLSTLRVEAQTPLLGSTDDMEAAMLTRAAGEAVALEAPRFAITFVDYEEQSLGALRLSTPEAGWIGTYEDLLEARAEAGVGEGVGLRRVTAVVRLLGADEEADRQAFQSEAVYELLLQDRIDRKDVKPGRRLRLPRLRFE